MDIVIDASAIIAVLANEPERASLLQVTAGADLLAPASVHWEIGNAFSAMVKRGKVSLDQAMLALESYYGIPIRFVDVELDESLRIAARLQIHAYDAYLVRCAIRYAAPLLTLDKNLRHAAITMDVSTIEVEP